MSRVSNSSIFVGAIASAIAPACVYTQVETRALATEEVTIVHAAPDEVTAGTAARVRLRYVEGPAVEVANAELRRDGDLLVVSTPGAARPMRVPVSELAGVELERVHATHESTEDRSTNVGPLVVGIVGGVILAGLITAVGVSRALNDFTFDFEDSGGTL